eukprot:scaffold3865_cov107-Cylindrotheca_fusiformis.AAC.4
MEWQRSSSSIRWWFLLYVVFTSSSPILQRGEGGGVVVLALEDTNNNNNIINRRRGNDDDDESSLIKVMVGFRSRQEEDDYLNRQGSRLRGAGVNQKKVGHKFKNANAVTMEVTREEFDEMSKDPQFDYVEEDILVYKATSSSTNQETNDTANEETQRLLREITSYGLWRTQADQEIPPADVGDEKCLVHLCIVDSGLFLANQDVPYSLNDGYIIGNEFGLPAGERWYNPIDTDHGTGVAGVMIAKGGNDKGVVGVLPNGPKKDKVCLMIARVFPDGKESTSVSNIIEVVMMVPDDSLVSVFLLLVLLDPCIAAEWCEERSNGRPTVINMSVAAEAQTSTEANTYAHMYNKTGMLIVAAAGNKGDTQLSYPASHDSVISVASVNSQLQHSSWSQYNDKVELSAPGAGIPSLMADTNGNTMMFSGTSFATPYVAGIATKLWAAHPDCTNQDIRMALRGSAMPIQQGKYPIPSTRFGYGLVQAMDANEYMMKNFACAQSAIMSSPSSIPTDSPTANPTMSPTPVPCRRYLESCITDDDCCDGNACHRQSMDTNDPWICRRIEDEIVHQITGGDGGSSFGGDGGGGSTTETDIKPKLARVDDGKCRGGYAGGCTMIIS